MLRIKEWLRLKGRLELKEPKLKQKGELEKLLTDVPAHGETNIGKCLIAWQRLFQEDRKARAYVGILRHRVDEEYCCDIREQLIAAGLDMSQPQNLSFKEIDPAQVEENRRKAELFLLTHNKRGFAKSRDRTLELVCAKYRMSQELIRRVSNTNSIKLFSPRQRAEIISDLVEESANALNESAIAAPRWSHYLSHQYRRRWPLYCISKNRKCHGWQGLSKEA
ncbi:hypothetical protein ACOME3_000057 [Neoechinorhynchus agilis]